MNTIFYDRKTGQVRIAYVPVENPSSTLRENMIGFINQMEGAVSQEDRLYLETVKSKMEENNYYLADMINLIGDMKRKLL